MNFILLVTLWNIFCVVISTPLSIFETEATTAGLSTKKQVNIVEQILKIFSVPIAKLLEDPKVQRVLRNVGVCIVNGIMEVISLYIPAPFLPLITSVAGKLFPYEPVIALRRVMPVATYKTAIQSALDSFLNSFNVFKLGDEDPYMTKLFRRRFLTG